MIPGISRVKLFHFFGESEWFGGIFFCGTFWTYFQCGMCSLMQLRAGFVHGVQLLEAVPQVCMRSVAFGGFAFSLCVSIPVSDVPISRTPNLTLIINRDSRTPRAPADQSRPPRLGTAFAPGRFCSL